MIQPGDDKKPVHEGFKGKQLMLDLDEYLKIFIIPQIPVEYKEIRGSLERAMEAAWHALFKAAVTTKRERQRNLVALKVELSVVEIYIREVKDICYRGKEKRRLDKNSSSRFTKLAKKESDLMGFVWAWAKSEDKKLDSSKTEKTAGLIEKEDN